jgi:hypothetical protein
MWREEVVVLPESATLPTITELFGSPMLEMIRFCSGEGSLRTFLSALYLFLVKALLLKTR